MKLDPKLPDNLHASDWGHIRKVIKRIDVNLEYSYEGGNQVIRFAIRRTSSKSILQIEEATQGNNLNKVDVWPFNGQPKADDHCINTSLDKERGDKTCCGFPFRISDEHCFPSCI